MPRTLGPEDVTALRDAVVAVLDSRIEMLDQSLSRQFDAVNERLDLVKRRIARLEERVAGLVQGHTRARTSDIDRIVALEARVAELEAKLAAKECSDRRPSRERVASRRDVLRAPGDFAGRL